MLMGIPYLSDLRVSGYTSRSLASMWRCSVWGAPDQEIENFLGCRALGTQGSDTAELRRDH